MEEAEVLNMKETLDGGTTKLKFNVMHVRMLCTNNNGGEKVNFVEEEENERAAAADGMR